MQGIKRFLNFVEIRTKLATTLPFLAALAYVFYTIGTINLRSTLIYICAALLLDMSVTAINSHFNTRKEGSGSPHYKTWVSLGIIAAMMLTSGALGFYLVYLHGVTILFAGLFCVFTGIAYSFGPAPICKSPYGELISGFTVSTVVMFIVVSINNPAFQPLGLAFIPSELRFMMDIDIVGLLFFVIVTLPSTLSVTNIMLANNICDAEADRSFRYTLVHSIGLKNSLRLFTGLYYAAYLAIVVASFMRLIPLWCLLTLVTFLPVQKNIRRFLAKQSKRETFALSVKNYAIIMFVYTISMAVGGLLRL